MLQQVGLPSPPPEANTATLIGLAPDQKTNATWLIAPSALTNAYISLLTEPDARPILAGLRDAVTNGTASALQYQDAIAKTGTAPCHHRNCIATSDGLVILLAPATSPRTVLLLRQTGSTGAATAAIAAHMLPFIEAPHAQ